MTKLYDLYTQQGQSPWLDNLRRDWIVDGTIQRRIDQGVRGMTSNPSIFQKAMTAGQAYDEQFAQLVRSGSEPAEAFLLMALQDIKDVARLLRPVYDGSGGTDGFVSLELAPEMAHDTQASIDAARTFHDELQLPNLMVKIPATEAGIPAIRQMVAEGRNINITLLFTLPRYQEVMDAYLAGLEAFDGDRSQVNGVASFFVSRVDTEVDRRLDEIGTPEALALRGKAAVAQAKMAYQQFRRTFSGERWEALAATGAQLQRPLWASTSTKNPAYSPTLYVDELIGPDTVNTMPEATIDEFEAHGTVARTIDRDADEAERTWQRLAEVGVDLADVGATLEDEGVAAFSKAFQELVASLEQKAAALR